MYDYVFHAYAPIWDKKKEEVPLGGSHLAFINVTRELAKNDCHVICYTDCQGRYDTSNGNLEYKHVSEYDYSTKSEYFVSLRHYDLGWERIPSERKILWSQDNIAPNDAEKYFDTGLDRLVCVSDFHRDLLQPWLPDRIQVIHNSLDFSIYPSMEEIYERKVERSGVYLSNPDRGLENLLEIFKMIKETIPNFSLSVFSSWLPYAYFDVEESDRRMEYLIPNMKDVTWSRGYNQPDLIRKLTQMDVFLYPTEFVEAGCYAFIQACACGIIPIVTWKGVFPEWEAKSNYIFDLVAVKDGWKKLYADKVCRIVAGERNHEAVRLFAERCFDIKKNIGGWLVL